MNQMNIFDMIREPVQITKPIRLIELFAGYGSQAMALRDIGAQFEHYRVVEFDKYAVASYNAIHGTDFPPLDITQIHADDLNICDTEKYCYFMTYSFPCTDLSVAGKQAGMKKGSGTRSGLLWEVERILCEIKEGGGELPQILFMENVPQVHADANKADFQSWIDFLTGLGYVSYWQDLNAKDYGIAQNRNRCFMFSFLGEYNYRFPPPEPLTKKIRDYLEETVDARYYVSDKALKGFAEHAKKQREKGNSFHAVVRDGDSIAATIKSRYYKDGSDCLIKCVGRINSSQDGKVVDPEGIVPTQTAGHYNVIKIVEPTIVAMRGRNPDNPSDKTAGIPTEQRLELNTQGICNTITSVQKDNMVLINQATKRGSIQCEVGGCFDASHLKSKTRRGRVQSNGNVCPTLTAHDQEIVRIEKVGQISNEGSQCGVVVSDNGINPNIVAGTHGYANNHIFTQYRIRKLTPRECGRLMDVTDADIDKMAAVNSDTQLYKQFGNSIVKAVMCAMFKNLNINQ